MASEGAVTVTVVASRTARGEAVTTVAPRRIKDVKRAMAGEGSVQVVVTDG